MNEIYYVITSFSNGVREYYSRLGNVTEYFPNIYLFEESPDSLLGDLNLGPFKGMTWEIRQIKVCME